MSRAAPDHQVDGAIEVADVYPLAPMQGGMLYHTLADPGSGVYVVQYTCEITGELDTTRFRTTWAELFERHAVLRTAFVWEGLDEPLQVIRERVAMPWTELDWADVSAQEIEDRFERFLEEDRASGFALDLAPLTRWTLIRTGPSTWRFLWSFHHILADGWSAVTLLQQAFHEAAGGGSPAASPRPFRDFVEWLGAQDASPARAYWSARLDGADGPTRIAEYDATDLERAPASGSRRRRVRLDEDETAVLREFARGRQLTLSTLLHGAWSLVLGRYSGETDVLFSTAVSGRPTRLSGVESMIGLFINSVPVRVELSDDAELIPWLRALQIELFEMRPCEHASLAEIADWTGVGAGHTSFESVVVFQSSPLGQRSPAEGTGLELSDIRYLDQSNVPLALLVFPDSALELLMAYDPDRFGEALIDRLLEAVASVLRAFVAEPGSRLGTLPPPDADERSRLLTLGDGGASPSETRDVLERFFDHADRNPESPAMASGEVTWTYEVLAERVRKSADRLRRLGVGTGTRVAVMADRSLTAVQGMLATLHAGGAYVPIASDEPGSRRRFLLEDAGARLLICDDPASVPDLPPSVQVITLEADAPNREAGAVDRPGHDDSARAPRSDLAYVLYTSGSTGRPKGVAVSRGNLAYSTGARSDVYDRPPAAFLLLSPLTFDSSVVGLFWTLTTGGMLVLPEPGEEREPTALGDLIRRHGVTHTLCVPGLWALVLDQVEPADLASLETVIVAGEACPPEVVRRHQSLLADVDVYNEYGPTETTVWATAHRVRSGFDGRSVCLGRPVPGARIYVLDGSGRLCPTGAAGEICIAGSGVSQGYLNRDELTAAAFVPDPFTAAPGHMYRTGDQGRWSTEGELLFLGRSDEQIKVRGRRIEPGEIAATLVEQSGVREAAVVGVTTGAAGAEAGLPHGSPDELVAYVVLEDQDDDPLPEIRRRLRDELPAFMVPTHFIGLSEIPRGRNGKVDRSRLPAPDPGPGRHLRALEPSTPTEVALAAIWRDVLNSDSIALDDHFFEIGGHSLLAIRLLGAIRNEFSVDLPFDEFFEAPTVAGLAARLERRLRTEADRSDLDGGREDFEF